MENVSKAKIAYIVGVALGDGNLSNPNGRAARLRITCDTRYPNLANEIIGSLKEIFPKNKVSIVPGPRATYMNISVYSNKLNALLPWKVGMGSKLHQQATIPTWIFKNKIYAKCCLKGLLQTDGSIYRDRGYIMINFTNHTQPLAEGVFQIFEMLGYRPTISRTAARNNNYKYCVRLARDVESLIKKIDLYKS